MNPRAAKGSVSRNSSCKFSGLLRPESLYLQILHLLRQGAEVLPKHCKFLYVASRIDAN